MNISPLTVLQPLSRLIYAHKITRFVAFSIMAVSGIAVIGLFFYSFVIIDDVLLRNKTLNDQLLFPLATFTCTLIMYMLSLVDAGEDFLEIKLKDLEVERKEITKKIESSQNLDIFHTIQLSLNQLNEYYTINKGQAVTSFRFSISAIVIGLLTIIVGVWMNYIGKTAISVTVIAGVSGVILEFIGGAYFFMYKKSLEQVNFFFGQLIKIQDTMLAIKISDSVSDSDKKTIIQEKIIVSLLERSLK